MPLFGTDFDRIIDLKSDNAYSGYFDTAKKNRILREAINKAINNKVKDNDRIQIQDDLFGIFKSNAPFTPTSNEVDLIPGGSGITDYFHMMNVRAQYLVPLDGNFIISAPSLNTPLIINLYKPSNLRTGQNVSISGITGNTNANGLRYLKMITPTSYRLYSDVNLTSPVVSNGSYSGTAGIINQVFFNYAKDLHSSRKFASDATVHDPFYEIADSVLKVYPLTRTCSSVTVDYVSMPSYIDVSNTTIDYLTIYSAAFIDYIADMWCLQASYSMRDEGMMVNEQTQLAQNP